MWSSYGFLKQILFWSVLVRLVSYNYYPDNMVPIYCSNLVWHLIYLTHLTKLSKERYKRRYIKYNINHKNPYNFFNFTLIQMVQSFYRILNRLLNPKGWWIQTSCTLYPHDITNPLKRYENQIKLCHVYLHYYGFYVQRNQRCFMWSFHGMF